MKTAKRLVETAVAAALLAGSGGQSHAAAIELDANIPNFTFNSSEHPGFVNGVTINVVEDAATGTRAGGNYTVNAVGEINQPAESKLMRFKNDTGYAFDTVTMNLNELKIVNGAMSGIYMEENSSASIKNYVQKNRLKLTVPSHLNVNGIYVGGNSRLDIGNLTVDSIIDASGITKPSFAHNGIYAGAAGAVINVTGNAYINTNIPGGAQEAYDGEYGAGVAKNDAVSGKYGGVVNLNVKPGTTEILDPNNVVQILGNIDVKDGTVNAALSGADSFWYGSEVGGVEYDKTTHTYGDLRPTSRLSLSLADGAQWVPDIMPIGDGGAGDSRAAVISAITLHRGGIVNMHGLNKHTDAALTVNELTIYNLATDGGIFRIDASGEKTGANHRNGTDYIMIKSGSGSAYVQPLDSAKLEGVGADNPVQFADAASGVTFVALPETSGIEEGVLYDYEPIIAADYTGDSSAFGRNWYFVDVKRHETPTADTAIAQAALDYAAATARLEIDSLNKRLGELRDYDAPEGFWFRYKRGEMEGDGVYFKDKYNFYQLGWDRKRETDRRGVWRYGLAAHYGDNSADYAKGSGSIDSFGASVYAGWTGKLGHYADFVLKYSHLDNDFTVYASDGTAKGGYNNWAMSVSAEYGYKFDLGRRWILEPQSQLVYTHIFDASYATSNGIEVRQDGVDSLIGRLGFRLGREFGEKGQGGYGKWYVKADLLHEFCGDREVSLYGAHGQTLRKYEDGGDTWFAAGIGADVTMGKNSFFYCDVEKSFGADIETNWQVNLGVRWEL
ncbi:MAG: autotransporter outer membrane beta-barrel domain-containing protein [Pyramidobacter sp.]|nr:autotransporter outer membrane beta-barrel domain-containing protein [Pyramidobacter sp.]MDY4032282.1 autotransporter outer membrane beta-barrel domain-containing protein [Pyramidobacter sp.]